MGVTAFDIGLIEKALEIKPDIKTVMQIGSQNLYIGNEDKPPFMSSYYHKIGIECESIDLAGDDGSIQKDMAHPFVITKEYDLLTDHGSGEHIVQMEDFETVAFHDGYIHSIYPTGIKDIDKGYYYGWSNKHNLLKTGGLMICVNPKTGFWPEHCYTYITTDFYKDLAKVTDYEIIELGENCAMGNCETGVNIYCIMRKTSERFPDFDTFQLLDKYRS